MSSTTRRWCLAGTGLLLVLCSGLTAALGRSDDDVRGQRLFNGEEPVLGKIGGHPSSLPTSFTRCANCHTGTEPSRLDRALETRTAPQLSQGRLLDIRSRRGGPPFAYDKESFCHTIRTGIDPQYITLGRAMPRFEITQAQCDALWTYLTRNETQHERQ